MKSIQYTYRWILAEIFHHFGEMKAFHKKNSNLSKEKDFILMVKTMLWLISWSVSNLVM